MIGLAVSPGTEVEPVCSRSRTRSPSAARIRSASRSKSPGQAGSYSTSSIGPETGCNSPTVTARSSASRSDIYSGQVARTGVYSRDQSL